MMTMEHIETAKDFLEKSDGYFDGEGGQDSENGWPFGGHRSLKVAEKFHENFYHKFIEI